MNQAQIHLALNHAPLFLALTGAFILIIGMFRKNESFKTLSLYILTAAALFTIPVYLTGEGTEELVEKMSGVTESDISEHEEMANIALVIVSLTGVVALAGIVLRKKESLMKLIYALTLILGLSSFGVIGATAHLGGKIRHTELGANTNAGNENGEGKESAEKEEKEETGRAQAMPADSTVKPGTDQPGKKDKDDDD